MLKSQRLTRKKRVRAKVSGTSVRPRLMVYRSNKFVYVQLIDDKKGKTLAESHGVDAKQVGSQMVEKARKLKIKEMVFDRSGYKYHGKVKDVCEVVREGGVKI